MSWSDKIPFYEALKAKDKLKESDIRPEMSDGEGMLMSIFSELSTARQIGMGIGPIPVNIFWDAQDRYGLTDAAINMLRTLDLEYVKQNASKS
jgi:hypothetical protein